MDNLKPNISRCFVNKSSKPMNQADHKYSVSVCCYYSSDRRNLTSRSRFLAGVKKKLWCVAWTIITKGGKEKHKLIKIHYH